MLNTRNFQSQKTKDSAWLSYTFLYRISNIVDPAVKVYAISERPLCAKNPDMLIMDSSSTDSSTVKINNQSFDRY